MATTTQPLRCDVAGCKVKAGGPQGLAAHKRLAHGEPKPCPVEGCTYKDPMLRTLHAHMHVSHGMSKQVAVKALQAAGTTQPVPKANGNGNGKGRAAEVAGLVATSAKVGPGAKASVCPTCSLSLPSRSVAIEHMRTEHGVSKRAAMLAFGYQLGENHPTTNGTPAAPAPAVEAEAPKRTYNKRPKLPTFVELHMRENTLYLLDDNTGDIWVARKLPALAI